MSDTQWPRFEVFQQDKPGQLHYNAGSVHAPDAEMALLNARDVFARRPRCHSMWVVPVSAISAWTYQELVERVWAADGSGAAAASPQPYAIFRKELNSRNTLEHVIYTGEVAAASPEDALQQARTAFDDGVPVAVWWVVPTWAITRSDPEEVGSFYEPALSKQYRQPNHYHTRAALEHFRQTVKEA
ncbi:MAG: phenylacetic acid degradation protein [Anaerolineae bacterium]|nr:phenylacetic acid degradation protein [Anaerolineae bacterium]